MTSLRMFSHAPCDRCARDELFIGVTCQECGWVRPLKPVGTVPAYMRTPLQKDAMPKAESMRRHLARQNEKRRREREAREQRRMLSWAEPETKEQRL